MLQTATHRPQSFIVPTDESIEPIDLYENSSKIGYGLDVFSFIDNEMKPYAQYVGGVVIIYTMILYFMDCYHWASYTAMVVRRDLLTILARGVLLFVISIAGDHPYGWKRLYFMIALTIWTRMVVL